MSIKTVNWATTSKTSISDNATHTHDTGINTNSNQTSNDFTQSINGLLDQTRENINRSIDQSRNQIPRYNNIVKSYQEQSLQTAKEISEEYIESQKAVISSLQSAWRPYSESITSLINSIASPDSITKAYTNFASSFADNAVSAIRLTNNITFSNLDSRKSTPQQARDNLRCLSSLNANAAKTFEQNSRQKAESAKEANSNSQNNQSSHDNKGKIPLTTNPHTITPQQQQQQKGNKK